jgi:hypothetical protein
MLRFLAFFLWSASVCYAASAEEYALVFSGVKVPEGERIVGFDVAARPAYFSSMRCVPLGWDIDVNNDPSWTTHVTGSISVGAAAIDLAALNKILRITSNATLGDIKISGEIVTSRDFEHEHHLTLKPTDVRVISEKHLGK